VSLRPVASVVDAVSTLQGADFPVRLLDYQSGRIGTIAQG
jgi:hypothetical protein